MLVVCQPESTYQEEMAKKRKVYYKYLEDCLLKEEISTDLKKNIEENKKDGLKEIIEYIFSPSNKYPADRDALRKCRLEFFEKKREESRKRFKNRKNSTRSNIKSNKP